MDLEERLMGMDFSQFSNVRESLLAQLIRRRQVDFENELMNDEELDEVAAAGTQPLREDKFIPKKL